MERLLPVVLAVAATCAAAAGCSARNDTVLSAPPSSPVAAAPRPSGTSSSTPRAEPDLLTADSVGSMAGVVWREDINYETSAASNEDLSVPAGAYELQAVCTAGRVKLTANRTTSMELGCSGALGPGLKVCTTRTGVFASVARLHGPVGDLVWQLKRVSGHHCSR
jgi:hypothetical protein